MLSPFLWLLRVGALLKKVDMAALERPETLGIVARCHQLYADDVLSALAHENQATVEEAAECSAEAHEEGLKDLGLKTAHEKSENFLLSPDTATDDSIFRRRPNATYTEAARTQNGEEAKRAETFQAEIREANGSSIMLQTEREDATLPALRSWE